MEACQDHPMSAEIEVPEKRSAVELHKEQSNALRGTIDEELRKETPKFGDGDKNLLKFHGTYQQEDRDARKTRRGEGLGKFYMFMVRCKIPGGRLTAAQYLAVDELAGRYANGTLRFTSRQGIQLHGVLKQNLRQTIADINGCLLSTLGACGDVERNLMACPAPIRNTAVHDELQAAAARLAAHLAPRTHAYHEIWLNGKSVAGSNGRPETEEPLYGKVYLPRKFKTGLALPEDNCIDVYAQDLGFLAVVKRNVLVGYNVLVGGGMGMSHGNDKTFPHLARAMCYIPADQLLPAAEAVIKLFRDHGNRADRKRARIKYLVHDWGVQRFRKVLSEYMGGPLTLPKRIKVSGFDLHLGWHPQGDGKWFYGLSVENGRVKDEGSLRLRTALRVLMQRFQPEVRLTPMQDILLCNLDGGALAEIESILAEHGVQTADRLSVVQKYSMSCPAIPTCGLAISESERALPGIIDDLEILVKELGLEQEAIGVRMTGCPNGCVRPYQSEIGIVGRSGDKYVVYVGGSILGNRMSYELCDLVPRGDIMKLLRPLLEHFKDERNPGETFGDYCQRLGVEHARALLPQGVIGDQKSPITPLEG
jgi:sulfite reductase (ferredoxin)